MNWKREKQCRWQAQIHFTKQKLRVGSFRLLQRDRCATEGGFHGSWVETWVLWRGCSGGPRRGRGLRAGKGDGITRVCCLGRPERRLAWAPRTRKGHPQASLARGPGAFLPPPRSGARGGKCGNRSRSRRGTDRSGGGREGQALGRSSPGSPGRLAGLSPRATESPEGPPPSLLGGFSGCRGDGGRGSPGRARGGGRERGLGAEVRAAPPSLLSPAVAVRRPTPSLPAPGPLAALLSRAGLGRGSAGLGGRRRKEGGSGGRAGGRGRRGAGRASPEGPGARTPERRSSGSRPGQLREAAAAE